MWIGHDNAVITGDLVPVYPGEHHDLMYETVILHCNLDAETVLHVGGALLVTIGMSLIFLNFSIENLFNFIFGV